MTNHFITTDRGKFHYATFGEKSNPVLMLIHGYPQTYYCWKEVGEALENSFYVITPDLRGMGDSERTLEKDAYHKNEMAKDMFSIVDALGIDKFNLGGHDWGSGVAQDMLHQQTDRITKFITLNFPIIHNKIGQMAAYKKLGERLFASFWYQFFLNLPELPERFMAGNEEFWIRFCVRGKHVATEEAVQEYTRCLKAPNSLTTYANLYRTMKYDMQRWSTPKYTSRVIPVETLVIHGALDTTIIKEYYTNIENCFESVRIEYLDGGHFICDELPKDVAAQMRAFLS